MRIEKFDRYCNIERNRVLTECVMLSIVIMSSLRYTKSHMRARKRPVLSKQRAKIANNSEAFNEQFKRK